MSDFYPWLRVPKKLEHFKKSHPEYYDIIETFAMDMLAQGLSEIRVSGYISFLSRILKIVNKDPREYTKDDVRKIIAHYQMRANNGEISQSTVFEVKKTLKKFFKWLGKEELVDWFSIGRASSNLSPQDLITHEEFEKMLNACRNSRDRAMLCLLYESGARIGEIASMRIKDVVFDDYGAVVWLPKSKTIRRKVRVVYSARYLAEWLENHPLKDDRDAPLWIKLTHKKFSTPMDYKDIRMQIKKIAKRAGVNKRIYPHLFRHTRATRLLQQVSEVVGAKYMGWVPGTKMIKTYIHLADQDVERAILEMHGIKPAEGDDDIKVLQCPRCSFVNPGNAKYCSRCGLPLTEEAVREVEEWEERKAKLLEAMTNPEIQSLIMSLREEIERLKKIIEGEKRR